MKNHWIVRNLPRLAAIKRDRDATLRQITRLQKVADRLAEQSRVLDRVTEIFEGTALCVINRWPYFDISRVGDDPRRWATVYPSIHKVDASFPLVPGWGVIACSDSGVQHPDNVYWPEAEAVLIAKTWVAKGTYPKQGEDT